MKGLAELHGGSVHAQSRGKGLGAEFTLALPASAILQSRGEGRAESSPPAPAPSRPALILIAADNRDAAETMGSLLELAGHRVLIAHSGAQALSIGEQIKPDAVILDIGMPDMNGYEVARAIRAKAWGRGVSIIAVTGWGQPADKASAHEAGFQSASDQARDSAGDRRGDCGVPRATRFDRFAHHEHLIRNEPALERGCACVHGRP